ncbi:CBS domain-containing protein CBSX5-like [Phragmites australis]|uniref:CBS domain-containing protein CBSX5-like n=1 Tax=Phragmites australis TaxID=29695 RepID=UPI002D79BC35|nr:CBS domain-containing protein CBSX5-like [Phragmites australis]
MAVSLLSHVVSDLCIGRPRVLTLPPSTPVAVALAKLRAGADPFVFVDAEPASRAKRGAATVYVKVSVADILCYVCSDTGNLTDPAAALARPVSAIAAAVGGDHGSVARRVDPQTSLLDAIDVLLADGCQGLLVSLHTRTRRKHHYVPSSDAAAAADCCVLTREDIVRHLFGSISHFSHIAFLTVASLGLVRRDVHAVHVDDDGLDVIPLLRRAISDGTAVAVVADDNALIGEICPGVLGSCDVQSVFAALAALSAGNVMTYIYCSLSHTPPEFLLCAIRARLKDRGLEAMAELMDTGDAASLPLSPSSTSSDEDSPIGCARRPSRVSSGSFGWRSTEDVVACHAMSSLVAVMAQALAHRVGYVWVVDEASGALVGVVRFADVLAVLREQIRPQVLCR